MPDFPRGNYRDWGDEGSERSSIFTDEAGYQSSNADRRSTCGSVASNDERNHPAHENSAADDGGEDGGRSASMELASANTSANTSAVRMDAGEPSSHTTSRRRFQASRSVGFATGGTHGQEPASAASGTNYFLPVAESHVGIASMGPPLSRALLMQSTGDGSVKSYGSDDGFSMLNENARASPFHESTASSTSQVHDTADNAVEAIGQDSAQPAMDNMDEGSQTGNDFDDCACSLDVETHSVHSVGNRSTYSQDDASLLPRVEAASIHDVPSFDTCQLAGVNDNLAQGLQGTYEVDHDESDYHAQFLHLPLQSDPTDGPGSPATRGDHGLLQRWKDEDQYRQRSAPKRSRSRSRSPDSEDDSKPEARKGDIDRWKDR